MNWLPGRMAGGPHLQRQVCLFGDAEWWRQRKAGGSRRCRTAPQLFRLPLYPAPLPEACQSSLQLACLRLPGVTWAAQPLTLLSRSLSPDAPTPSPQYTHTHTHTPLFAALNSCLAY